MTCEKTDDRDRGEVERDLFGAPVRQIRERWGRPSFAKTTENQRTVALLVLKKWSQARIAAHLGCDEKTLRKHFSRELRAGADLIEAQVLEVLYSKMRAGNMGAVKRMLELAEDARAAPPPKRADDETEADAPRGKKEETAAAARTPGAAWGNLLQ